MKVVANVRKVEAKEGSNLLAYADITIEDAVVAKGLTVVNGSNGPFVSFPKGKKYTDKEGKDVYPETFFPITADARNDIVDAVLAAYNA